MNVFIHVGIPTGHMPSSSILSVIIPVYNDPDGLRQTLFSLINQRHNLEFEIVVVDNNSTDNTPQVVKEFEGKHPEVVFSYKETDIQSSYAARNTGIQNASGEILAFIDADVTVESDWVTSVIEWFEETTVDYLGCNVEMYIPDGRNSIWAQYDISMGLPVEHYLETKQFMPTCALAVRREVIDEIGFFDQSLTSGGDKEFGKRVHRAGYRMEYDDQLLVRHPVRTTFEEHIAKAKRIGVGQYQLWQRFDLAPHPFSPVRFLPPNPKRVVSRSQSRSQIAVIYLISYLLKLIQAAVAMKEFLKN